MLYLALGCIGLALFLLGGKRKPVLKRREWRFVTAAFAILAFAAAAYSGLRGAWEATIVLIVVGLWLATTSRHRSPAAAAAPPKDGMSLTQARSILGVGPDATPKEIKAAYTRLMRMAHPDKGGTAGLASQLNTARDRLLQP